MTPSPPADAGEPVSRAPLTKAQIAMLQKHRKTLSKIEALCEDFSREFALACECEMTPASCYVCALLSKMYDIQPLVGSLAICLDASLEEREFPEFC